MRSHLVATTGLALFAFHAGAAERYALTGGLLKLESRTHIALTPAPARILVGQLEIDREARRIEGSFKLDGYRVHVAAAGINASNPPATYRLDTRAAAIAYDPSARRFSIRGARLLYDGPAGSCEGFLCRYQPQTADLERFDLELQFSADLSSFNSLSARGVNEARMADTLYEFTVNGTRMAPQRP